MQPSQVNCYLDIGVALRRSRWCVAHCTGSEPGTNLEETDLGRIMEEFRRILIGFEILRVKNAGCNEDIAVEPAEL